jgi:hypothetical protein
MGEVAWEYFFLDPWGEAYGLGNQLKLPGN